MVGCQDDLVFVLFSRVFDIIINPVVVLVVEIEYAQSSLEMRKIFDDKKTFFLDEISFVQKFFE